MRGGNQKPLVITVPSFECASKSIASSATLVTLENVTRMKIMSARNC